MAMHPVVMLVKDEILHLCSQFFWIPAKNAGMTNGGWSHKMKLRC